MTTTATPIAKPATITARLAAPFDPRCVKWLPKNVRDGKAIAIPYVDTRAITKRLGDVLGVEGWQDDYEFLPNGSVLCRLSIKIGDEWIVKTDVGSPQAGADPVKTAVSSALKRAALKLRIGRYLYGVPKKAWSYDNQQKCFCKEPTLPSWALPPAPKKEAA